MTDEATGSRRARAARGGLLLLLALPGTAQAWSSLASRATCDVGRLSWALELFVDDFGRLPQTDREGSYYAKLLDAGYLEAWPRTETGRRADAQRCYQRAAELDAEDEEWRRMAAALSQAR